MITISFHNGIDRFRCCTSFVQAVVNEIVLRTKQGQVSVVFEPGVKEFQYGSLVIRSQTLKSSRGASLDLPVGLYFIFVYCKCSFDLTQNVFL